MGSLSISIGGDLNISQPNLSEVINRIHITQMPYKREQ